MRGMNSIGITMNVVGGVTGGYSGGNSQPSNFIPAESVTVIFDEELSYEDSLSAAALFDSYNAEVIDEEYLMQQLNEFSAIAIKTYELTGAAYYDNENYETGEEPPYYVIDGVEVRPIKTHKLEENFDYALYTYTLEKYQTEFNDAQKEDDYVGMNKAHKKADQLRKNYLGRDYTGDDFDYTHGGKIYTYNYEYEARDGLFTTTKKGTLYILTDENIVSDQSIDENEHIAIDFRSNKNPNVRVVNSYKVKDENERAQIVSSILTHEAEHPSDWDRTEESMENEWEWHNRMYDISVGGMSVYNITVTVFGISGKYVLGEDKFLEKIQYRSQDVDFDNDAEDLFPIKNIEDFKKTVKKLM